jgi:long-chain acyl-CoA synthetase
MANGRGSQSFPTLEQVLRKRRIMITGATGFLGKVFLYVLLRSHPEIDRIYLLIRGDRRSALNRMRREVLDSPAMGPLREHLGSRFDRYVEQKLHVLPGDITEEGLLTDEAGAPKRGELDAVVHCAGMVNFEASLEKALAVNTIGVRNVLEFCRKHGAAMLHISTCYVAGDADGNRFEDEIPINWCPKARRNFKLDREIRDALAAIERIVTESQDHARLGQFRGEIEDDSAPKVSSDGALGDDESDGHNRAIESRRKRWVERQLKEVGARRAKGWGWPNTYSYTKSLGEQLVLAARGELNVVVVRPAVIESALRDPFPGWNQGVNTSAPLSYMSGRGFRFYPARPNLVLDVIPVDLVAHAMVPILAAMLLKRHEPIYQLGTSDKNPLPMRRLVELTALSNRREQRNGGGPLGRLMRHLEPVVVSPSTYELGARALPNLLKQATELARTTFQKESARPGRIEKWIDKFVENTDLAHELVEVYRPYIQDLVYTFHCKNIRALYAKLPPEDARRHEFRPDLIDWRDYWINVHLPGLRRHIFPQLDLHTRSRPRGRARYRSLVEMLDAIAEKFGSRPAMVARKPSNERVTTSYRELRDAARRAALLLAMRGVKQGDRVLLVAENSPEWVLAYFAILCAGAIAVPLDHQISADELPTICKIAAPKMALVSKTVSKRLGSAIRDAAGSIGRIELSELSRPFILRGRPSLPPAPERKALASIVFTSGTTGAPKGVMLMHGNFAAQVAMLSRVFELSRDDIVLSLLPLHHTFEFTCGMLLPLASGATIVYPLGVEAANLARTLADVRPTAVIGVPALWQAIHRRIIDEVESRGPFFAAAFEELRSLNRRLDRDFRINLGGLIFKSAHSALGGRLRLAVSGGAALPTWVSDFFNDVGIRLLEGYGLTEAAPVLSVARPDEPLAPGSVGKPLSGIEVKLDCAERSNVGEIVARGPNIMAGYYRNKAATDDAIRDGWLHTGDLGRFDGNGRLFVVGRAKDVIVDSAGNTLYIDELEEAYAHSPYLKELAIVGIKIGEGEQVAALAVPAYAKGERRRAVEDRLCAHFGEIGAKLSPAKRVKVLRFSDQTLPRTRTRKVKRIEVAAMLQTMLQGDAETKASAANGEVEAWLADALADVASGAKDITPATRLVEDLGLDSLALAELAEHIGDRAGRELSPEDFTDARTVEDLQRLASEGSARPRLPSYARFAQPLTPVLPRPLRRLAESAFRSAERAAVESWLKPRIFGRGNIPFNRNVLVVANHASHFDFLLISRALGAVGRELVVLAARDYFFNTALRRFVATNFTRLIPFDRERAQMDSLEDAMRELAAGRNVLMFPEGTRSPDGAIHEFKSGAGYLALRSGCDVLPIHIRGTHEVLGKGMLIPRRNPVELRIGRVITADELHAVARSAEGAGGYHRVAEHLRAVVTTLGAGRVAAAARSQPLPESIPYKGREKIRASRLPKAVASRNGKASSASAIDQPAADAAESGAHRRRKAGSAAEA